MQRTPHHFFVFFHTRGGSVTIGFLQVLDLLVTLSDQILLFADLRFQRIQPVIDSPNLFLGEYYLAIRVLHPLHIQKGVDFGVIFFISETIEGADCFSLDENNPSSLVNILFSNL